jgi:hypothetical protein
MDKKRPPYPRNLILPNTTSFTSIIKSQSLRHKSPSIIHFILINRPTCISMQNDKGQGVSHATDSQFPQKIREKAPSKLEHELPDSFHDTGSNKETGKVSHAVDGDSKVSQALQEAFPKKLEKAVPNAIHNTGPK